jgi:pimeloyl-ACP methyl ester carboxylesterase
MSPPAVAPPALLVRLDGRVDRDAPGMLMVHGWPDDEDVFERQSAHFASRYRVARVRLPWFSSRAQATKDGATRRYNQWGYDFDVLTESIAAVARDLGAGKGVKKIVLVGHDWGAGTF